MNLEELKSKFKHKQVADIKDLNYVLQAGPFLVREVERLENELAQAEKRIEHLLAQTQKKIPLERTGKYRNVEWKTWIDEKKNRLFIQITGRLDYNSAKSVTNNVLLILPNLRKEFDLINDVSKVDPESDSKASFHFRKLDYSLKSYGIRKVIRVINPKSKSLNDMFESLDREAGFKTFTSTSIEDASNMLDNVTRHLKV